jgi:membrane fusion protein, heavy metal efflux system
MPRPSCLHRLLRRASAARPTAALVAALALGASPAGAADGLWTARAESMRQQIIAYATVEPRSTLRLRAGVAGIVASLTVQPGDSVRAGETLGRLTGPPVEALLVARRAALTGAEATLKSARQELALERQKFAGRLTTRGAVGRDAAALSNAQASVDATRAALSATEEVAVIRAPRTGRVLSVDAFSGERVAMGETLLTLLPANDLWLRATVYGAAANVVRPGMTGRFAPAGGGPAVPVKVRAVVGALERNGGRTANLVPTEAAIDWLDGETGAVTLDAGTLSGVSVPTRALILDQAKWWLLVHTAKGDVPQEVTPGPSRGAFTLITHGLAPGSAVEVENPYLEFHHGISEHYQPPD